MYKIYIYIHTIHILYESKTLKAPKTMDIKRTKLLSNNVEK